MISDSRWKRLVRVGSALVTVVMVASCSGMADDSGSDGTSIDRDGLSDRLALIDAAVQTWREAPSMAEATAAAETAANLVVGPNGPGYGDRDGDGMVGGDSESGLLPGLDGSPEGIAFTQSSNPCVLRDVLGGSWDQPEARWDEMLIAIDAWEPGNNTMPSLASHPMRIVGWSSFTIGADSLAEAHEYGGHAALHVAISRDALDC